jgi:hypothetical protein
MAYDEGLAHRIRAQVADEAGTTTEIQMLVVVEVVVEARRGRLDTAHVLPIRVEEVEERRDQVPARLELLLLNRMPLVACR